MNHFLSTRSNREPSMGCTVAHPVTQILLQFGLLQIQKVSNDHRTFGHLDGSEGRQESAQNL